MIFNKSIFNTNWKTLSLVDLGTFKRGKSKHRPRNDFKLFTNGKYPLVQTGEIKDANLYINKHTITYNDFGLAQSKLWPSNTLCITIAANIAETAILKYPMCFPDSIVGFNSFVDKSDVRFVYYIFEFVKRAIQNAASGSIQDNINIDFLSKLKFRIPSVIEQSQIAKILSDLDAKIELNNKINAELEAMAKLIYDYWFVQFEFPHEFKTTKTDKNATVTELVEVKPYKSSGGKMVWNEELKREIPEGWKVKALSQLESNIVTGKTPSTKRSEYYNGDIPFICIGDVRGNMHITKTELTLTEEGANTQSNKYIPKGAICVTCIASPGLVGFATEDSQTNQQLNSIVCEYEENRYYLYFYLLDYFLFAKAKTGNTFANMNKGDFSSIKVLVPSSELCICFYENINSSMEKVRLNSLENNKLAELRDWLLPMLMNGQVKVN